MKLLFLGPPGAGKGTLAQHMCDQLNYAHISTGDMLRDEIKSGSSLGAKAGSYIEKGQLVPDDIIIRMVVERLKKDDCSKGFILDGFPRTRVQAEALDEVVKLDLCVNLIVGTDLIIYRIIGRRICGDCGRVYHVDRIEDKQHCARCGCNLISRKDDNEETIRKRLAIYEDQTKPLVEYYRAKGILIEVDGSGRVEDIYESVIGKMK